MVESSATAKSSTEWEWAGPELQWRGGRVLLSRRNALVRFESPGASWEAKLPSRSAMFGFLDSRAEVLGDMLLIWTSCEHANAGGGPYVFELHRVREDGAVAWSRLVDLLRRENRARLEGTRFEVYGSWTERLDDEAKPGQWRRLDPDSGADLAE